MEYYNPKLYDKKGNLHESIKERGRQAIYEALRDPKYGFTEVRENVFVHDDTGRILDIDSFIENTAEGFKITDERGYIWDEEECVSMLCGSVTSWVRDGMMHLDYPIGCICG